MRLTEDHRAFRDSVRRFVDTEINPHVDELGGGRHRSRSTSCSPSWPRSACSASSTTPAYGGQGADHTLHADPRRGAGPDRDAAASPMAIARADRHGHPVAGTASASDELKEQLPGARHAGARWWPSIAVTEPDAGSRRGRPAHPGRARRRRVGDQRLEALHHQRHPGRLAVPAGPHLRRGRLPGHVARSSCPTDRPASRSAASSTSSASGRSDTAELSLRRRPGAGRQHHRRDRAAASSSRCSSSRTSG